MVASPRWSADKIRIRITVYDGGFLGYPVCSQRLEGQTCNPYLSLLVASEIMSGGYGFKEINPCQMTRAKFEKGFEGF